MKFDHDVHHRRSIRLKNYDYGQPGAYYSTICTRNRECLFGEVINGGMVLNDIGLMVRQVWDELHEKYNGVETDEFIIMPNHVHGIIILNGKIGHRRGLINQTPTSMHWIMMKNPNQTLGKIIPHFKAKSSKLIRDKGLHYFQWQRNYLPREI